jgi:C-terminal processing protease CtpA/Prc
MANDSATFRVEALLSDQLCENLVEQTVSILKEEGSGYGLTVSGDNPVFVQAVKEGGPADRAGVRPGDRILMVNDRCVSKLGHVEVVQLIKATKLVNLRLLGRKTLKTSSSLPILSQMTKQGKYMHTSTTCATTGHKKHKIET